MEHEPKSTPRGANFLGVMLDITEVSIKVLLISSNCNWKQFRVSPFPFPSSGREPWSLGFAAITHTYVGHADSALPRCSSSHVTTLWQRSTAFVLGRRGGIQLQDHFPSLALMSHMLPTSSRVQSLPFTTNDAAEREIMCYAVLNLLHKLCCLAVLFSGAKLLLYRRCISLDPINVGQ